VKNMKNLLFALLAVTFVISLCFAQPAAQPTAVASKPVEKPVEIKTFTGKVDSVVIGDIAKKTVSEIVALDEKGQKLSFVVRPSTSILAKDGKAVTLNEIKKDNKVTIEYTTSAAGTNKAKSIQLAE
jgi:ABC-type oligopeptide transport system substrate-binding subunit